jgi:predicted nucleotidyltransferase component of viral defense system
MNKYYLQQVELLLEILPILNNFPCFALKGGTAINMFVRNMPRLSIDIDLTYLPIEPRDKFLSNLTQALEELANMIVVSNKQLYVEKKYINKNQLAKLIISNDNVNVKIEPNLILRGYVFNPETRTLCQAAQDQFLQSFKINCMSFADLYGGKICAALDRQHPRDLFDIKILLEDGGITDEMRQAFVAYLASSPRPMSELLRPNLLDITDVFQKEFLEMTDTQINCIELEHTRKQLINYLHENLTEKERKFLLSVKHGEPEWALMGNITLDNLPALKWKVINIQKMDKQKRLDATNKLKEILGL